MSDKDDVAREVLERGDALYRSLKASYDRVAAGTADDQEMASWHDFWLALLGEYANLMAEIEFHEAAPSIPAQAAEDTASGD